MFLKLLVSRLRSGTCSSAVNCRRWSVPQRDAAAAAVLRSAASASTQAAAVRTDLRVRRRWLVPGLELQRGVRVALLPAGSVLADRPPPCLAAVPDANTARRGAANSLSQRRRPDGSNERLPRPFRSGGVRADLVCYLVSRSVFTPDGGKRSDGGKTLPSVPVTSAGRAPSSYILSNQRQLPVAVFNKIKRLLSSSPRKIKLPVGKCNVKNDKVIILDFD
ncbi:hypothetical protein F2P81_024745 [Scophthalmus maximus]|uniref:Uncharacterized protein n=1 Tax=Scophthalmus maximus TaxID=52904 RepID=A0A6A4RWA8_SCOMX|nr:hypothetical protein F2P81_024745 [Scophthalmus maximus]